MQEGACRHSKLEFLGEQRGEKGVNKYFRCQECGAALILSEEGVLYEVPGVKEQ